jgi:hypothetical protein
MISLSTIRAKGSVGCGAAIGDANLSKGQDRAMVAGNETFAAVMPSKTLFNALGKPLMGTP